MVRKKTARSRPGKKKLPKRVVRKTGARRPAGKRAALKGRRRTPAALGTRGLKEAAAAVAAALSRDGHDPLLAGRACAAIYGGGSIKAQAIEFVIREFSVEGVDRAMKALGFRPRGNRTYASAACPFEVALVPAPLSVGDDAVVDARTVKVGKGAFRMLTPTDCVRQRLSMFYRWGDREALKEAIAVARRQKVDLDLVRRWSEWEWAGDRYREFAGALDKGF